MAAASNSLGSLLSSWGTLLFLVWIGFSIYLVYHWWKNRKNARPIISSTIIAYERRKSLAIQSCSAGIRGHKLVLSGDQSMQGQVLGAIKGHLVLINQFTKEADKRRVHLFFVAKKVLMLGKTDLLDLLPFKRPMEAFLIYEHDIHPQKKVRGVHIVKDKKGTRPVEGFISIPQMLGNVIIHGVNPVPFGQFYSILNKDVDDRKELFDAINSDVYVLHSERNLERIDNITEKALLGSPDHQKGLELAQSGAGFMTYGGGGGGGGGMGGR